MATLSEAAAGNDRRETLLALRDKLAVAIDECSSGRDIAALSKRLMEVMGEIDALPDPNKADNPVQAARRRARERAEAT